MRNREATRNKSKSREEFVRIVLRKSLYTPLAISVISMAYAQNSSLLDPSKEVMILDGCFRSQLRTKKVAPKNLQPPRRLKLNINNKELVEDIHIDYLNAGANVIRTNTYWASEWYMKNNAVACSTEDCVEVIQKSVESARKAISTFIKNNPKCAEEKYFILGSCGSATNTKVVDLDFRLNQTDEIINFHKLRVETLIDQKVDAIAFESIETDAKARAIVDLMQKIPNSKVWMSFRNLNRWIGKNKGRCISETIRHCCNTLQSQIIAIGINCIDLHEVAKFVPKFKDNINRGNVIPIAVCPRVGDQTRIAALTNQNVTIEPMDFVYKYPAVQWTEKGACYIGGCCNMVSQVIDSISGIMKICYELSPGQILHLDMY